MNLVKQQAMMGCSVACVASVLNITYEESLKLFDYGSKYQHLRGFYNHNIIKALSKVGLTYKSIKVQNYNYANGDIVFARNKKYGSGHYLLNTDRGWMDPWINYPNIDISAGYRRRLLGKPQWRITKV